MKEGRLSLRLPAGLLKESKAVARRRKTTLSALVQRLFEEMVEVDKKTRDVRPTIDAEQV